MITGQKSIRLLTAWQITQLSFKTTREEFTWILVYALKSYIPSIFHTEFHSHVANKQKDAKLVQLDLFQNQPNIKFVKIAFLLMNHYWDAISRHGPNVLIQIVNWKRPTGLITLQKILQILVMVIIHGMLSVNVAIEAFTLVAILLWREWPKKKFPVTIFIFFVPHAGTAHLDPAHRPHHKWTLHRLVLLHRAVLLHRLYLQLCFQVRRFHPLWVQLHLPPFLQCQYRKTFQTKHHTPPVHPLQVQLSFCSHQCTRNITLIGNMVES